MLQALRNRLVALFDTLKLHKAGNFSHVVSWSTVNSTHVPAKS